jgi:predicted transglutaminase-like cysteine proteinase
MSRRLKNLLLAFTVSSAMWAGIVATASYALGAEPEKPFQFYYTVVFTEEVKPHPVSFSLLSQVNTDVNKSITYRAEGKKKDKWQYNPAFGDCEDYAYTKMIRLNQHGVPFTAMRLARGLNGTHMVLIVYVGNRQYVLDNMYKDVYRNMSRFTPITTKNQKAS